MRATLPSLKVVLLSTLCLALSSGCLFDKRKSSSSSSSAGSTDGGSSDGGDSGDSGTTTHPETAVVGVSAPASVVNNFTCQKVTFTSLDINGTATPASRDIPLLLAEHAADGSTTMGFYSDAVCSQSLPFNTAVLSSGSTTLDVYFNFGDLLAGGVTYGNRQITTTSTTGLSVGTATILVNPRPVELLSFFNYSPSDDPLHLGTCYSIYVSGVSAGGYDAFFSQTQNTTLTASSVPSGSITLYSNSSCTTPLSSLAMAAGSPWVGPFYFKATTAAGDGTVTLQITGPSGYPAVLQLTAQ